MGRCAARRDDLHTVSTSSARVLRVVRRWWCCSTEHQPVTLTGPTEETTMRTSIVIAGSLSAGALALALAVPVVAAPTSASGTCTGDGPVASSTTARGAGGGMQCRGGSATADRQHATPGTGTNRSAEKARGTGRGKGQGQGQGQGRAGQQARGTGGGATMQTPSGTLTAEQRTELAAMAEEEKMAHDVYVTLAARYPELTQFSRIAASESQHLSAVRTLMTRYGITDPTLGMAVGEFESDRMQSLYDSLVAGATTQQAALAAGVTIEKTDIADLQATMADVTAPDVVAVYTNLLNGSQRHLAAFSR
jgi:hypothetical protein